MRIYAVGDIHGYLDKLRVAHARITADRRRTGDHAAPVVHVGDLVDRGPDSRGVIDYLMRGQQAGANWTVLKGNHDRMFAGYLDDPRHRDPGLRSAYTYLHSAIGGDETLASYGIDAAEGDEIEAHAEAVARVPEAHRRFLSRLPTFRRLGEVILVHAGLRPGIPPERQTEDDLVWIRAPFLDFTGDHGMLVVHGHTAIPKATHYGNRVNIDSRGGYSGPVTAVVIEGRDVWVLDDDGRTPLLPEA